MSRSSRGGTGSGGGGGRAPIINCSGGTEIGACPVCHEPRAEAPADAEAVVRLGRSVGPCLVVVGDLHLLRVGLVVRVVPDGSVVESALETARLIAANSPLAPAATIATRTAAGRR